MSPSVGHGDTSPVIRDVVASGYIDEVANLLTNFGPNVTDKDGRTVLIHSVICGNRDAFDAALSIGADPTIPDRLGLTAIDYARMTSDFLMLAKMRG